MTTENTNLQCGIANGMLVSIVDVCLKPKAAPVWDKAEKAHQINACEADCLVLRFHTKDWVHKRLHDSLAPGISLLGLGSARTHTVRLGYLQRRIRVTQFSILQTHALTGHKAQGMTVEQMVISRLWKQSSHQHTKKHLYQIMESLVLCGTISV